MEKTQIEELYSLPWEDKSCADPIEKARRVLGQIANRDSGYFYNDGYPRSVTIKKEVENVLKVLNTLAAAAPSDHTDDLAVDRFAAAMKAKMAASRAKGRNGWDNAHLCPVERLQGMLIDHLAKGDPVDIGNFAMMLWNRGEPVAAAAPETGDNGCKSCAILRRYEKTARERGYAMGKAAGNNELAQTQELLAFERKAHAETNAALTAEITRLEAQLAAAAPVADERKPYGWLYGKSFWHRDNPRITDDVMKNGKPLYE